MSIQDTKNGGVQSDRRTFLKRLTVVTPLGHTLSNTNAAACTLEEFMATPLPEEDAWRMAGHDPAHTGFNPVATGPEPPVDVKWRVSGLPGWVWPPVVVSDTAYVGTLLLSGLPEGDLRAFSTDSGTKRWQFVPSTPGMGIPAVVDGTIYFGGFDNNVTALDARTQSVHWTFAADGITNFPKVTTDTAYITDVSSDFNVYAIDTATGEERWRFAEATARTPAVAVANDSVYVGTDGGDTTVYALDATSGEEQWRFEAAECATYVPVVAHDTVYIASDDGTLYALDAASGDESWRFDRVGGPTRTVAVDDGLVYVGAENSDTTLYALDATTGEEQWRFEGPIRGIFPPAIGGERVYIGSLDTNVYAVDTTSGEERWRFEEPTAPTRSPVVVGETLYVGTNDGTLYALT